MRQNKIKNNPDISLLNPNSLILDQKILRSILDSLAEGVIVADRTGKFLYFNPVAEKILGIGMKDIRVQEWTTTYGCYLPDGITPYPAENLPLARAIQGEEISHEVLFIKNNQRPEGIYISISASPLRSKNPGVEGGIVVFHNITKVIKSERALQQSERRFKLQFKGFPVPTYIWQHQADDFILIDYNDAAAVFTRGEIQKFLGISSNKMYADSPQVVSDFKRCFQEKKILNRELTYRLPGTDELKELEITYVSIPPDLILVHTEDITERRKAEISLKKLVSAVEQTADAVVITDTHGIIEYINPAFEEMTGYNREEVYGQTPRVLRSGYQNEAFYNHLWQVILSGRAFKDTIVNKKKNGELFWCQQTITPMKDSMGHITNFVSVIKDITELKKKHEQDLQLRLARELQQRFYQRKISLAGYDIAGAAYPAVETGGDYFDFIKTHDDYIWLVVADVCGHGIGSALIMAEVRAYLHAFARVESDPGIVLDWLNRELNSHLDDSHYVTMMIVRLDPRHNLIDYSGAGHVPGYLLNGLADVSGILFSKGIPLGYDTGEKYITSEPISLNPKDTLVLISDGIIEAHALDKTEFGFEQVLRVVSRYRQATAKDIVEHLYQSVQAFVQNQPQEDDVTAIICKVNGT
jgi:sigma-B regulation protein RsbU (phosphoserine phosphatase)